MRYTCNECRTSVVVDDSYALTQIRPKPYIEARRMMVELTADPKQWAWVARHRAAKSKARMFAATRTR